MKLLPVYCENRGTLVYLNPDKILMVYREADADETCLILIQGLDDGKGPVRVKAAPESMVRMIHGDDKSRIGFRTGESN